MKSRFAWLPPVLLLLLLYFLLLQTISRLYLYSDEFLVYYFTRIDLSDTITYLATQDVHPPLWFGLFSVWRGLVGDSEFVGRFLSLLLSTITLAMTYRLGRDWFGRAHTGLIAMLLLDLSAYFVNFALEIRPYAATMCLSACSMWLFSRWLKRRTWRLVFAYGLSVALMFYVHYFLAFLVAAQIVYFLVFTRKSALLWKQLAGAVGVGLLAWSPWIPSFINQVMLLRALAVQAGNAYGSGLGTPATTQATNLLTVQRLLELSTNGQITLYAVLLVVGISLLWRRPAYRLVLLWALNVPAIALLANLVAAVYTPRYVAYLTIGLALASSAALVALPRIRRFPVSIPVLALTIVLLYMSLPSHLPNNVAYRDIFRAMDVHEGDAIYFDHGGEQDMLFLSWQMDQYLRPGYTVISNRNLSEAQAARRVWYITGDWFNPEVEATFSQLEPTHPVQSVLGQCDRDWCYLSQLMEAPPLTEALQFGDRMLFWGADVDQVAQDAINVRLWWRVEQSPERDYSIGVHLLDSNGRLVAQNDGAIRHYGTEIVQTSSLQPGRLYIDYKTLLLPTDRLDGIYTLQLIVYQSWDNVRLTVNDADSYIIDTITIQ